MQKIFLKTNFLVLMLLLITACGNGGGGSSSNSETSTTAIEGERVDKSIVGYLVDAPIANMSYECGDKKGKTTNEGKFECSTLPVTFKIGSFVIAKVDVLPADGIVYPQDLVGAKREDISNPKVLNIASFLQSLDSDGDLSIINIPDNLNIKNDKTLTDMSQEEINQLLESQNIKPIGLDEAEQHLRESMGIASSEEENDDDNSSSNEESNLNSNLNSNTDRENSEPNINDIGNSSTNSQYQGTSSGGDRGNGGANNQNHNDGQSNAGNNDSNITNGDNNQTDNNESNITNEDNNQSNIDKYAHIPKDENLTDEMIVKFLNKATFGATTQSIANVKEKGIVKWLDEQLNMPLNDKQLHLRTTIDISKKMEPSAFPKTPEEYLADNDTVFNKDASFRLKRYQNSAWFTVSLFQEDQLREKMGYVLSQIIVESLAEPIFTRRTEALSRYFDILRDNALGNYRDLLIEISHSSSMSLYLTFNGNKKEHLVGESVVYPDENYAREIMQLFTIGLKKLNMDGSVILDAEGNSVPTYTQTDITEIARVFTGWDIQRNARYGRIAFKQGDLTHPIEFTESYHDFGEKKVLGEIIPADLSGDDDIEALIDILMNHQNISPFISKILIQRLTNSNPTPAYIKRVAIVFQDNGNGVKGDLKAVLKAIFTDEEFWQDMKEGKHTKFKEPLMVVTQLYRAFYAQPFPKFRIKGKDYDVENVFFLNEPYAVGQAPGRAFSVFNFYDKEFIPNDNYFKANQLVAPELEIQTDDVVIGINNYLFGKLRSFEKKVVGDGRGNLKRDRIVLDCFEEDNVVEMALEGSVDRNITNLEDTTYEQDKEQSGGSEPKRALALKALIDHLDRKLTGNQLSQAFKEELFNRHIETFYSRSVENKKESTSKAIFTAITMPLIVAIMTSNVNMTE